MAIKEIWIPETVAVLFLAIPLLRPFVKALWSLDGLVWLPLVALAILAGIFPAYGFRLEVVPILVFAVFSNLANLLSLIASAKSRSDGFFQDRGPFRTVLALVLLAGTAVPMYAFAPRVYSGHEREAEPARNLAVPVEFFSHEYVLRVYGPVEASRPLIFLVPPEIGSAASVELVCEGLREKGFTVITYSRRDYDVPFIDENGRRHFSLARLARYWRILRRGTDLASANGQGRALETARRIDLEFLLPRLPAMLGVSGYDDMPPILFVGYGAGGSALAFMAGEDGFADRHGEVLGVVAVGSRLWSSFADVPRYIEPMTNVGFFPRLHTGIVNRFREARPQRVSRSGPLPEAGLPVLHLVSGRVLDERGQRHYRAVLDALHSGDGPVALAAVESAGPLDYQDFPFTQPMLSFFRPGLRGAGRSKNPIGDTVGIIGNFASFLLERRQEGPAGLDEAAWQDWFDRTRDGPLWNYENGTMETEVERERPAGREVNIPPRSNISGSLYIESRGLGEFGL